ncbi:MAG: ChaN family lipoprotein, partial [Pseudomonadota bacterium]
LGGDFHAFAQSQRAHLRLLRSLPTSMPLILVLECFLQEHQWALDEFMSGELSENAFLQAVNWEESWGFPWEHYRPLVQMAGQKGFRVVGLNSQSDSLEVSSLEAREKAAAIHVKNLRDQNPNHLLFVLFGDLHLTESRFPAALREIFADKSLPLTRVFQNSEELYFYLAENGLESQIEVMSSPEPDTYCLLASPPWVKWQSYLIYLEQTFDLDLEEEDEEDSMDFTDHVHSMVQLLAKDLGLDVETDELSVYTLGDDLSEIFSQEVLPRSQDLDRIRYLVKSDRSFVLPSTGQLFLSRFSINHAAGLAGMYLHFQTMDAERVNWRIESCFESWIWIESLAFFFSKWINHKRKPDSLPQLKAKLSALEGPSQGKKAMVMSMEQRLREVSSQADSGVDLHPQSSQADYTVYFDSSKILGSMLGEKIYHGVKSGSISTDEFKVWLKVPVFGEDFAKFYYKTLGQLETQGAESPI